MKIVIELTAAQEKALATTTDDIVFFATNMVHEHCRWAMERIFNDEVRRMAADPTVTEIPADIETVVLAADIKSMAERAAETPSPFGPVGNQQGGSA
jgi:hypothetical protein